MLLLPGDHKQMKGRLKSSKNRSAENNYLNSERSLKEIFAHKITLLISSRVHAAEQVQSLVSNLYLLQIVSE